MKKWLIIGGIVALLLLVIGIPLLIAHANSTQPKPATHQTSQNTPTQAPTQPLTATPTQAPADSISITISPTMYNVGDPVTASATVTGSDITAVDYVASNGTFSVVLGTSTVSPTYPVTGVIPNGIPSGNYSVVGQAKNALGNLVVTSPATVVTINAASPTPTNTPNVVPPTTTPTTPTGTPNPNLTPPPSAVSTQCSPNTINIDVNSGCTTAATQMVVCNGDINAEWIDPTDNSKKVFVYHDDDNTTSQVMSWSKGSVTLWSDANQASCATYATTALFTSGITKGVNQAKGGCPTCTILLYEDGVIKPNP